MSDGSNSDNGGFSRRSFLAQSATGAAALSAAADAWNRTVAFFNSNLGTPAGKAV